jgi:tetratricopeptide (TPR) repeat protein
VTGGRARYVQRRSERRRFAGRDRQIRSLAEAVENGIAGRGEVLAIVGGAGSGKSSLLAPVIDDWTAAGGHGLIGRCRYTTRTQPLAPVKSMLRSFLGLTGEETVEEKRRVCNTALAAYELAEGSEELTEFIANDWDDDEAACPFGDESWELVLSCVESFVHKRLAEMPILYILEDLHHADTLTLRLAMRLTAVDRNQRFLLIATTRPDAQVQPLRDRIDRELVIGNLGLRHSAALVALQYGARDVEDSVAAFLWERTKGNPGQLVELVRFLRDRGLITTQGDLVIVPPPGLSVVEELVPKTMAQFALARLDSLSEIERRVLKISSTIGRTFVLDVLESVAGSGLPKRAVELGISRLLDEGVIKPEIARRPAYRFRDDVTRAATYTSIPKSERRAFHRQIADVLERHSGTDVDRRAVILARHRERAEQLEEAARWYERAILMAASATLDEETRFLVDRWQNVVERLPEQSRPAKKQRGSMAVRKFIAVARHLGPAEALELGRHIASNFWNVMDVHERAAVDLWHGASLLAVREVTKAQARLSRAYETSKDPTVRCEAALYLVKCSGGDRKQEESWLNRATAQLCNRDNLWAEKVELTRACLLAQDGELDEARVVNARVRDSARRRNRLKIAAVATSNLADCDLMSGDVEEALAGFLEARVMARALGTRTDDAVDELNIGVSQLFCGRPEDARTHLEAALKIAREVQHKLVEMEAVVHLGAAIGLTEDLDTGESMCKKGREQAVEAGANFVSNAAGVHLLHLAVVRGDAERVQRYLEECENRESELAPLLANSIDALRSRARTVVQSSK